MTNAQEKVLLETNSSVNRILGLLPGLEKITHDNQNDVEHLQKDSMTKDDCLAIRKDSKSDKKDVFSKTKSVVIIVLGIGSLILAFIKVLK